MMRDSSLSFDLAFPLCMLDRMTEVRSSPQERKITINASPAGVGALLEYLYTNQLMDVDSNGLWELLALAELYSDDYLKGVRLSCDQRAPGWEVVFSLAHSYFLVSTALFRRVGQRHLV